MGVGLLITRNGKHLMELKYILYITVNTVNGKFYFGVHKTNPDVFDGYIGDGIYRLSEAVKDFPFHRAVRKYGIDAFKRTTICVFPGTKKGKLEALALERTLVNPTLLRSKTCYNCALGGGMSNKDTKKVFMFDLKGEFLRSFKSTRDAALFLNTDNFVSVNAAIKNNCRGAVQSAYGYFWSYKKEFTYKNPKKWKKIAQYTLGGKFLRYFDSVSQAEEAIGICSIAQALSNGYSSGNYQWRYYTGDCSDIAPYIPDKYKHFQIPIKMYDLKGNFIDAYKTVRDCADAHKELSVSQISRVLRKIIKSHKGYTFVQDEDIVDIC